MNQDIARKLVKATILHSILALLIFSRQSQGSSMARRFAKPFSAILSSSKVQFVQSLNDDSLETRASLFQKSLGFGDACTYSLIAKNVTNLLTQPQQQLKLDTLKSLTELIK